VAPSYATTTTQAARWFTFPDEIKFDRTGQPTGSTAAVDRPGTYSWVYVVRRPRAASPAQTELLVLVYAGRAIDSLDRPNGEPTFYTGSALGGAGSTTVSFPYVDKPNIRKGGWVMDTSFRSIAGNAGTVNAFCYQVAAVTDSASTTTLTLELESPLKADVTTLVVLENVITVLDRGTSWRP
jgi:hypothetical protein